MCFACDWARHLSPDQPTRHGSIPHGPAAPTRRGVLWGASALGLSAATSELFAGAAEAATGPADLIISGGRVFTLDPANPWAEAVAVRGKSIVYVGNAKGAQALAGPRTRQVDMKGGLLLPGFVEAHIHPFLGAVLARGVDLQFNTREETLAALRRYKTTAPADGAIRGFGWRYLAFPASGPVKQDLDAIWPDRPVVLIAIDGHGGWVNSRALELAGIARDTPDPQPGFSYYQRDAQGEPTGFIVEVAALMQVLNGASPMTDAFVRQSLEDWLPAAAAAGITTVFDAGMSIPGEDKGFPIYLDLERQGRLPFRVVGCYYHNRPEIDPLPIIQSLRTRYQSELVSANVLKLNIDGGDVSAYTMALLAPYADKPETSGPILLKPDLARAIAARADAAGIDVHTHACGDGAVRVMLDAFDHAIRVNPKRDRRNAIAHNVMVDPADIPRFAKLGVVAQYSAQWTVPDRYFYDVFIPRVGAERAARAYPIDPLQKTGARLAFGTDWPAAGHYSTYQPLESIEIAVTRHELGKPDQVVPPSFVPIALADALRANTLNGAWQLRLDDRIGSIKTGKRADLVLLGRDLFKIPPAEIHQTPIKLTVMNGRVTHDTVS